MKHNGFFILGLWFFSLIALTACNGLLRLPGAPVEITFYKRGYVEGGTDSSSVTIANAVQAFEKRHPDIKVKVIGVAWDIEGNAMLQAALEDGSDINVLSVNSADLPVFASRGYLSELGPYLDENDREDFYTSALQAASVNGKVYAWPLWVTAVAIYGNPDLMRERGVQAPTLEDPWTWDEFVAAAQALTFTRSDGVQVYGFSASSKPGVVVYLPFFYLDGGRVRSPDARQFVQNSPEAVSALQNVADLRNRYHVTPPDFGNVDQAGVRAQFKAGTLAMVMETPSVIADFQAGGVAFSVFPAPVGKMGKIVTSGAFGMYGVYPSTDPAKLRASHLFARYLTGSQVAHDVPGYQLAPGLRRSNTAFATDTARELIVNLVGYGIYEPPSNLSTDLSTQYELALQSILLGEKTAQQAMDEIAPRYQKELDEPQP